MNTNPINTPGTDHPAGVPCPLCAHVAEIVKSLAHAGRLVVTSSLACRATVTGGIDAERFASDIAYVVSDVLEEVNHEIWATIETMEELAESCQPDGQ